MSSGIATDFIVSRERQSSANADLLAMTDLEPQFDRAYADALDGQAESKDVTNPAGGGKVALDPTDRRTDTIFHNLIDETDSKSAREPVLDHSLNMMKYCGKKIMPAGSQ